MDEEFLSDWFAIDDSDDSKLCVYIDTYDNGTPERTVIRTNADCSETKAHLCAVLSVSDAEP